MSTSPTSELPTGTRVTLALDQIRPYWRNPRRISEEAIAALAESIRNYEYQQPIVVDSEHVIIVGHTRYTALRRLGVTNVEVLVADHLDEQQAAEWRLIDNRTSEYSGWDFDALDAELSTLGDRIKMFFPEVSPEMLESPSGLASDVLVAYADEDPAEQEADSVEFVCPSCFHTWEHTVTLTELHQGRIDAPTTD